MAHCAPQNSARGRGGCTFPLPALQPSTRHRWHPWEVHAQVPQPKPTHADAFAKGWAAWKVGGLHSFRSRGQNPKAAPCLAPAPQKLPAAAGGPCSGSLSSHHHHGQQHTKAPSPSPGKTRRVGKSPLCIGRAVSHSAPGHAAKTTSGAEPSRSCFVPELSGKCGLPQPAPLRLNPSGFSILALPSPRARAWPQR